MQFNLWRHRAFRKAKVTLNHPKMVRKMFADTFLSNTSVVQIKKIIKFFFANRFKFYGKLIERPFFLEPTTVKSAQSRASWKALLPPWNFFFLCFQGLTILHFWEIWVQCTWREIPFKKGIRFFLSCDKFHLLIVTHCHYFNFFLNLCKN